MRQPEHLRETANKPRSVFFHVAVIFAVVSALIVLGLLTWLATYLTEYEKSNPKSYVEEMLSLYRSKDYDRAIELSGLVPHDFFDVEQYRAYVESCIGDGKDARIFELAPEGDTRIFELRGSGKQGIRFELMGKTGELGFGLTSYTLRQQEIPTREYTVLLPGHASLLVDGKPAEAKYQTGDQAVKYFAGLGDTTLAPRLQEYRLPGFIKQPALALDGLPQEQYRVDWEEEEATITLAPSEENRKRDTELAVEAAQLYARFVSKDAEFSDFQRVLNRESEFYDVIRTYSNFWNIPHDDYHFENIQTTNIAEYSEDTFSAVVSFVYVIYKDRKAEGYRSITKSYPAKYRLSFLRIDGGFKAVNIEVL